VETTKQNKEETRRKPKPEEQEGMPQRQHCRPEKRRGDRNPECHEEHQKDVAKVHVAHPPKNAEKDVIDERKVAYGHNRKHTSFMCKHTP
jgi:hypothetical protein